MRTTTSSMTDLGTRLGSLLALALPIAATACAAPEGLMPSQPAQVTVKFDFDHRPLPDIPLPNDIATRPDPDSPTGLRINASTLAPTGYERRTRTLLDGLDGWGVYQPITIPFTGPIDVEAVRAMHDEPDYDTSNDAVYLINIDPDSSEIGRIHHLDVGNGNYPIVLERLDNYGDNDPRAWAINLVFEEADEDLNDNGRLDPGEDSNRNGVLDPGEDLDGDQVLDLPEDSDADGVLDKPNYLPGRTPGKDDLIGRADALMSFYERETNTLLVAPMVPLRERTRYAVVVTRRIRDLDGDPIGSPFAYINHTAQTDDLQPLLDHLPEGLSVDDIAFTFSYTTESITTDWVSVREGIYGHGPQAHLADEFPAVVGRLFPLKATGPGEKYEGRNPYVLHQDDWRDLLPIIITAFSPGTDTTTEQFRALLDGHNYIDFHAQGTYVSPQLFSRFDENLKRLPLDLQSWPNDLATKPVKGRAEEIPFWVVVPRKEVSVRGQGKMAPLVLLGHGYGSNRATELMGFAGFLAQFGVAAISTDNVSHGVPVPVDMLDQYVDLLGGAGFLPALEAIQFARGGDADKNGWHDQDLNMDGIIDSGVDFWTAYLFHMRDMVRQSALDYMQLIRIIRTWDGKTLWKFDLDGDGTAENVDVDGDGDFDLAGDFDGDGIVDIGSESPIYVMGGSLGGIMSTTLGALEPEVEAIIPIAGGGRLTDVANRSLQGGVPQAVLLRVIGPLYLATMGDDGITRIHSQCTELNDQADIPIATVDGLLVGDTMVAENLANGEISCGYLLPDQDPDFGQAFGSSGAPPMYADGIQARSRVSLPSDVGDPTVIRLYRGDVLVTGTTECELIADAKPIAVIDELEPPMVLDPMTNTMTPMEFEGVPIPGGKLVAFAEGFGLERNRPSLRRFMSLAQMVIDPTDPGVLARYLAAEPFTYPNKGDTTGARFLIVTSVGDMNVPASSGVTVGRAAGVVDFLNPDPRYGVPLNQVLLDTHSAEAVNKLRRYPYGPDKPVNPKVQELLGLDESMGTHVDIENFGDSHDIWGPFVPWNTVDNIRRLDPPLRIATTRDMWGNDLGGVSGAAFPYPIPQGQHGFALPGEMNDWAVRICKENFGSTDDRCEPENFIGQTFDVGWFMFHTFGKFMRSATESPYAIGCVSKQAETCDFTVPPVPAPREPEDLP